MLILNYTAQLYPDDKSDVGNFPDGLQLTHHPALYKINKHPVSFVGKCHATQDLSRVT
jgi:hypothetical protein